MPYDIPLATQNTLSRVRSGTAALHCAQSRTACCSTNEIAPSRADNAPPIEPMLLVHQEQVETFRLIAAAIGRGLKALARSWRPDAAGSALSRRSRRVGLRAVRTNNCADRSRRDTSFNSSPTW
jgi:hypothetical protein